MTDGKRKTIEVGSRRFASTSQLLLILFVALKLTGQIGWSWWWVLAPLWAPWAIVGFVLLLAGGMWLVVKLYERKLRRLRKRIRTRAGQR